MTNRRLRRCRIAVLALLMCPWLGAQGERPGGRVLEIRSYKLKPGTRDSYTTVVIRVDDVTLRGLKK